MGSHPDSGADDPLNDTRRGLTRVAHGLATYVVAGDKFEAIAREYLELKSKTLTARTYNKKLGRFEAFAFPFIGKLPITSIAAPQLLAALRRIKQRGNNETAHRVRAECGEVFR